MIHEGSISYNILSSLCQAECSCGWKGPSDQAQLQAINDLRFHHEKSKGQNENS